MNIKDYYSVLELDDSTIYSVIRLKKQFYKLSSRYHPDRFISSMYPDSVKDKYTSIVIAYNYLKSNCFKSLKNEDLATITPKDHNALKFINKINIYDKNIDNKDVDSSKFNEEFLKNISEEDNSNLKLFLELGLSEQDIDNQFSLLHPEPKTIKENEIYHESTLKLKQIINQRQEDIANYLPNKIIDEKDLNSEFIYNKTKHSAIIKYNKPDNEKYYLNNSRIDTFHLVDDEVFIKEYDLPNNPTEIRVDKDIIHEELIGKINVENFNISLKKLINSRLEI